jgi:hypothetical protein
MILLSLASRQIWPQVLLVAHLKPERLILLHSADPAESKGPAQRLKRFLDQSGLVPPGQTKMQTISDNDFLAVERCLDEMQCENKLLLSDCALNFTGGNKLMATAAFRWAARRGLRSCYLERRHTLTWFIPRDGDVHTQNEKIEPHITDHLAPLDLLRCQLDASEVEHVGQTLTLNVKARQMEAARLLKLIQNGQDPLLYLLPDGATANTPQQGDWLEYATAVILLKLGVCSVQRGLRLKVKSVDHVGTRLPHAEIDLLFNWAGRLWLVDCKDRRAPENLVSSLRHTLPLPLPPEANNLLERIASELNISQTKVLKEDLLAIREMGGLLGKILCIRKDRLPLEVEQYAAHNQITVIYKNQLASKLSEIIAPSASTKGT